MTHVTLCTKRICKEHILVLMKGKKREALSAEGCFFVCMFLVLGIVFVEQSAKTKER